MAALFSGESLGDIIHLNVGGTRFSTSKQTLTWVPDSFFSSMLSARISTLKDDRGAIFIDRDPELFARILNYLRTKEVDLCNVNLRALKHEAEFYSITPLVRRLVLCEQLEESACGDILFHGTIPAPHPPLPVFDGDAKSVSATEDATRSASVTSVCTPDRPRRESLPCRQSSPEVWGPSGRPPSAAEVPSCSHSRHSSADLRHSSPDCRTPRHPANLQSLNPLRVDIIKGHFNWIAAAFPHFVCLYRLKDSTGWQLAWTSPYIDQPVQRIALNAKVLNPSQENTNRMVAVAYGTLIQLWSVSDDGNTREIGTFNMTVYPEHLFFIGSQLVALSPVGKVGVWHAMTQNWQIQDVSRITSYDTAGSFLLLGCENGTIHNIDMQKFPLRMKDNDLLVTELYRDPAGEAVTALSVYLTPKTSLSGNWIEIAYGTNLGTVRVIVQHPETVGQGPQLFQTFTVHRTPITKVMLSEKHLISVCTEYNHVRSWSVTRFRGMISTQPGSMPLASFKVVSLDDVDPRVHHAAGNDIGPFGEKDEQQVFVQKVVTETDQLFIRLASTGKRVCVIKSVDGHNITAFCVHECEGSTRMGSRPRRYIFSGHSNGSIQMWDLSTAMDLASKSDEVKVPDVCGPSPQEIMEQLDLCELSNSCATTPSISPSPSLLASTQHTPQTLRRRLAVEQLARNLENHGLGPTDPAQPVAGPSCERTAPAGMDPSKDRTASAERATERGQLQASALPCPKVTKF